MRGERREKIGKVGEKDGRKYGAGIIPEMDRVQAFIKAAAGCQEKRYPSIGMGYSCRYSGEVVVGAALEVDRSIPHLVFFAMENGNRSQRKNDQNENFLRLFFRRDYLFKKED